MASDIVPPTAEQRCIEKIATERESETSRNFVGQVHNMRNRSCQYAIACVRYSKFPEDCKEVLNLLHAHVQPTAVCEVNVLSRFWEIGELQSMIFHRTVT
jgi:hypothetical protein